MHVHRGFKCLGVRIVTTIEMFRHTDGKSFCEFGVAGPAMVTLTGIFHHQLPIRVFYEHALERQFGIFQIMRCRISSKPVFEFIKGGRVVGKANKQSAIDIFQRDRFQPMFALFKIVGHPASSKKRTVEIIGPAVIWAYQLRRGAASGCANHRAAMTATVMECPNNAFTVAGDKHRPFADHH